MERQQASGQSRALRHGCCPFLHPLCALIWSLVAALARRHPVVSANVRCESGRLLRTCGIVGSFIIGRSPRPCFSTVVPGCWNGWTSKGQRVLPLEVGPEKVSLQRDLRLEACLSPSGYGALEGRSTIVVFAQAWRCGDNRRGPRFGDGHDNEKHGAGESREEPGTGRRQTGGSVERPLDTGARTTRAGRLRWPKWESRRGRCAQNRRWWLTLGELGQAQSSATAKQALCAPYLPPKVGSRSDIPPDSSDWGTDIGRLHLPFTPQKAWSRRLRCVGAIGFRWF